MVQTFPNPKIKTSINKLYLRGQEKKPRNLFHAYVCQYSYFLKPYLSKLIVSLRDLLILVVFLSYSRVSVKLPICISSLLVTGNTKYLLLILSS